MYRTLYRRHSSCIQTCCLLYFICLLFMHTRYPKNTYPTHFKHIEAVRIYNFWGGKRFVGLAYQGKDIVFQMHYRVWQLKGFWPQLGNKSNFYMCPQHRKSIDKLISHSGAGFSFSILRYQKNLAKIFPQKIAKLSQV